MTDMEATIMQAKEAYQTAQAYAKRGDMIKAAKVLRGVDHPKCEQLLSRIQATPQYRQRRNRRRMITGAIVVIVLAFAIYAVISIKNTNQNLDAVMNDICATQVARGTVYDMCK